MVAWYFIVGGAVVILGIALAIEDSREAIIEALEYIISFEWFDDLWDFVTSGFENLSELSFYGLAFGALTVIMIFALRNQMLEPFVKHFTATGRIFWTIATYVTVFGGGYFLGKAFENG